MSAQAATLTHFGAQLYNWLQQRVTAQVRPSDPLRDAADEAAAVRALADTYRLSDRSFASDLYAAADRHESNAFAAAGR